MSKGLIAVPKNTDRPAEEGRFAYEGLDRVLHEKGRLAILTSLTTHPKGLLFGELKKLTIMTDGNLSRHLDVLHESGMVEIWKGYEGKRPQTLVRLTAEGRSRFVEYLGELEKVIRDAKVKQTAQAKRDAELETDLPPGWVPI